jgi:hypothetical protein
MALFVGQLAIVLFIFTLALGLSFACFVIIKKLENIEKLVKPVQAARINFYATIDGEKKGVKNMFLKVTQTLPVSITITDKLGNPAKVDGLPQWAITDASLAELIIAEDGMSATIKPMGTVGAFKVQVKADADLGEGVKEIVGELDVELLAGDAEVINLSAGQPTDI